MWIVRLALRRPYTFVIVALLIVLLGVVTILRTPTDIFPDVNIPVVSVIWSLTGTSVTDMEARIVTPSERAFTRHDAAPDPPVQRLQRPHPPARGGQQDADGGSALRRLPELHSHPARDRAGRVGDAPVWRQAATGHGASPTRPARSRAGCE